MSGSDQPSTYKTPFAKISHFLLAQVAFQTSGGGMTVAVSVARKKRRAVSAVT